MAPKNDGAAKKVMNKGAWTSEEDRKLSEYIEIHGAKRWKTVAAKSGYISYMFLPNISTEGEKWKKKIVLNILNTEEERLNPVH